MGDESFRQGCQPDLQIGEDRLFFLKRGRDGRLCLNPDSSGAVLTRQAPALLGEISRLAVSSLSFGDDVTDQVASVVDMLPPAQAGLTGTTNLYTDGTYGLPWRFIGPDRGERIPYLVDADYLPSGMSLSTALTAVSNALAAWKMVASVDFEFEGVASFGMSAADLNLSDQRLRIQLHNSYGEIAGANTLGIGGNRAGLSVLANGWTTGGRVFLNDFHHTTGGYVVLNHTNTSMRNASTFEEVLCHEIGHALSMKHSSENPGEPTTSPARQSIMYFQVHADGRGAAPQAWDASVIRQSHPIDNTPPYSFNRMMDITTAITAPAVPGINEILLTGDLQSAAPAVELHGPTLPGNGTFTVTGSTLHYVPADYWSQTTRYDPAGNSSRGSVNYRLDDGAHASPWARVRVLSFNPDTKPSGAIDGIPDNWMAEHFGHPDPAAGANSKAYDDHDGDGLTNMEEYRSGMNPVQANSAQRLTATPDGTIAWQGKAYELYELWGTTNLVDWFFVRSVLPTNGMPSVTITPNHSPCIAFRAFKVP